MQHFRRQAIERTLTIAQDLYRDLKGPVPVKKLAATLDLNFGYHASKVRADYLTTLVEVGKLKWDRKSDTVIPADIQEQQSTGESI